MPGRLPRCGARPSTCISLNSSGNGCRNRRRRIARRPTKNDQPRNPPVRSVPCGSLTGPSSLPSGTQCERPARCPSRAWTGRRGSRSPQFCRGVLPEPPRERRRPSPRPRTGRV
jgi:hypothetical protein